MSSTTSTDHEDEHTYHEEYKSDGNDYRDEDLSTCTNSNILSHDDKYKSQDLLHFTNGTYWIAHQKVSSYDQELCCFSEVMKSKIVSLNAVMCCKFAGK